MKQTKIVKYYTLFAFIFYLATLGAFLLYLGEFYPLWFSLACFLISIYCFLRGIFFALDSALWLGIFLLGISLIGAANLFLTIQTINIVALCFVSAAAAAIIVALIFKNFLLFKISFILLLETMLILLYSSNIINLNIFLFLNAVMIFVIGCKFYEVLKIGDEKKENNLNQQKNKDL